MEKKQTISTRKLVLTALLAALTVVGSALRITLPLEVAGTTSFHLGNIMCALSGILLGPWLGGLAAGLGSAIYDMTNPLYISECWITFLTKACYGLAAGFVIRSGKQPWSYAKAAVATLAGAVAYAALYLAKSYFYSGLLIKGLTPDAAGLSVIGKLPATVFNAVVAIIFAPILAVAIRKALEKNHMPLPTSSGKAESGKEAPSEAVADESKPKRETAPTEEAIPESSADESEPKAEETDSNE